MQDAIPVSPAADGPPRTPPADWVRGYFASVDSLRPGEVTRHFAVDGRFRFGNAAPAVGHAAITAMLERFYGQLSAMHHENTGLWTGPGSAVFEAVAHFTRRADGRELPLPAVSILRFNAAGLIADFRMAMDAAPLQS